jgi:hypothetical protein
VFGGGVDLQDVPIAVNGDDGIQGRFQDGVLEGLGLPNAGFVAAAHLVPGRQHHPDEVAHLFFQ